jgi:hypothetical protein
MKRDSVKKLKLQLKQKDKSNIVLKLRNAVVIVKQENCTKAALELISILQFLKM